MRSAHEGEAPPGELREPGRGLWLFQPWAFLARPGSARTATPPTHSRTHALTHSRTQSGTLRRSSSSHSVASPSLGARQSPRGESEPPEPTLGPLGIAERLNWLVLKK